MSGEAIVKRDVLSRYECAPDGTVIIDVAAARVEELYEEYDKSAPYIRRDLDTDLVEYLIECARELDEVPFLIRFTLKDAPDEARQARIRSSIDGYFLYLAELEIQQLRRMFRRSSILFAIGLGILFVSLWAIRLVGEGRSVIYGVLTEGLNVAAWVALWEALALFLLEWSPHRKDIKLYRRLANTPLEFRSEPANEPYQVTDPPSAATL